MNKSSLAIASLFLTIFVDAAGIGIVFPALTPLLINNETGLVATTVGQAARYQIYGLMLALYPLMMFAGSPLLGDLSDRFGRKPVLLLCLAGNAAGLLGTALGIYLGSLSLVLLGRAVCGVTAASLPVAQAAIIDISTPATKSRNLSMITAANGIGFAIGPVIGGAFTGLGGSSLLSFAAPFFIGALLPAVTLLFVVAFFSDIRVAAASVRARGANASKRIVTHATSEELRQPFGILAVFLTGYYIFFNYMSAFSLLMYGFDAFWEAILLSYYSVCFAASLLFIIPALSRAYSPRANLVGSLLCQPILIVVVVVIHSHWSLWATVPLLALAVANTYVTLLSIASNRTTDERQGQVMGVASSINALTWGIAPVLTSVLQPYSIVLPIVVSALVLACASALGVRYYSAAVEFEGGS